MSEPNYGVPIIQIVVFGLYDISILPCEYHMMYCRKDKQKKNLEKFAWYF